MNLIIDEMAPTKIVQCKKDYAPYIGEQVMSYINDTKKQLSRAITMKNTGEWRIYKPMRNKISEVIEKSKVEYYNAKLNDTKTMWSMLKDFHCKKKLTTPKKLIHNGEVVTKPKKLANILNEHYINKIENIEKIFQNQE